MRRRAMLGWLGVGATGGAWGGGVGADRRDGVRTVDQEGAPDGTGVAPPLTRRYGVPTPAGPRTLSVRIPVERYHEYAARPRDADYLAYATDAGDVDVVGSVAADLVDLVGRAPGAVATLEAAVGFVQGLAYVPDADRGMREYPKYPVETLVEGGGDCEDTAALLARLLAHLGHDVALLVVPEAAHMAVGVSEDGVDPGGTAFGADGSAYYYVETVEPGWAVGEIPDTFAGEVVDVLALPAR